MVEHVLHRSPLRDESGGSLLADTGTAGDIIGDIALESQKVDDLRRGCDAVAVAYLLRSAHLEVASLEGGTVHQSVLGDELAVILVRGHHVGGHALGLGPAGKRADDVVGLEALDLDDLDAPGPDDVLDKGDGVGYVLGLLVALGLVLGVCLVTECLAAGRVEADGHVGRILLAHYVIEGVDKTEYGRGVSARRGYARRANQGVVCAVDQRVGVKQEQFLVFHICSDAVILNLSPNAKLTFFESLKTNPEG